MINHQEENKATETKLEKCFCVFVKCLPLFQKFQTGIDNDKVEFLCYFRHYMEVHEKKGGRGEYLCYFIHYIRVHEKKGEWMRKVRITELWVRDVKAVYLP